MTNEQKPTWWGRAVRNGIAVAGVVCAVVSLLFLVGCAADGKGAPVAAQEAARTTEYLIGPGDNIKVFVWRNPEISATVPVRPDGKISTPLVEDMVAVGKTPTQLARDMEQVLATYIKKPVVNVIVESFVGQFSEQIRVVGEATNPRALPYREEITVLDVMIEVGGLTQFAAGNRAKIVRKRGGQKTEIKVRLQDLIADGDISKNVEMFPGDILIIPESFF
ncbi:MAG: XrtA/PEP-CTERM system exopolysaccharide export protein [Gammaproteobacteria bacterium]